MTADFQFFTLAETIIKVLKSERRDWVIDGQKQGCTGCEKGKTLGRCGIFDADIAGKNVIPEDICQF